MQEDNVSLKQLAQSINRINYTGTIYTIGQRIKGLTFSGQEHTGHIIEYSEVGGWYWVQINEWKDTIMIRVETATLV